MSAAKAEGAARDVRIDRIGFLKELNRFFAEPLIDQVKGAHAVGTRLTADFFTGLVSSSSSRTIDAADWLKLYESKAITKTEFLAGLKVSIEAAEKTLDGKTFAKLVVAKPGELKLYTNRRKGAEAQLIEAVKRMGKAADDQLEAFAIEAGRAA